MRWHCVCILSLFLKIQKVALFYFFHIFTLTLLTLLFSCSVMSNSLWSYGLQHPRLPCPSLSPWVYSNSIHSVSDAIQPSLPLLPPSPLALTLSQHQGLFQCVSSSHLKVAKVLIQMTIISTTGGKNALRNGAALIVKQNKTKQSEMKYFGETSKMTQLSQFVSKANHWLSQ